MGPNDRAAVDSLLKARPVRSGATLFIAGEPGDSMLIIARGSVAIVHSVAGHEQVIAEVGAGEFVGEMACIDPAPRSATVRAIDDVVLFELTRADFARLRRLSPGAAAALTGEIIQEVTKRLRAVDEKIERAMSGGILSSGQIPVANASQVSAALGRTAAKPASTKAAPVAHDEPSLWQRFVSKVRGGG